jgi:serine/threonine-protein kinase
MQIGSYDVLLELARGGMGKVYLARALGPAGVERLVAIKRAHEHLLTASRVVADRFLDEARIAAYVHHSNVIGVHQAGSDDDGYYLVLDYVEGESLLGLLEAAAKRKQRVPPQIVLRVVCDALAGLHAAHEATDASGRALGILHRDVSPQNLLVGRDGVTRLTDFGIAKSALSLVVTEEHYVQGKLVYMPPEYLRRKPVSRTLDVYAMGMTLWIALANAEPWPGAEEAQLLQAILVTGVPSLASAAKELGPEIAAVVDRACRIEAGERFATARAMLDELERASASIGGLARHVEVAEFVEELLGSELASRRELLKSRREAKGRETTPKTDDASRDPRPVVATEPHAVRPRSRRGLYVAALAIAFAVLAIVAATRPSPGDAHGREAAAPSPTRQPAPPTALATERPPVANEPPAPAASEEEPVPAAGSSARPRRISPRGRKEPGHVTPFSPDNPYK